MDIRYPATVERQKDGTFFVQFVDLPDTFSEGQTKEEALFNAAEVLSAMLAWRLAESKDVPAPSQKIKGVQYIAPDAKTQAAMLLLALWFDASTRVHPWVPAMSRRWRSNRCWCLRH